MFQQNKSETNPQRHQESEGVTGIILCGGKSTRMGGQPKGLIRYKNHTFVEKIYETMSQVCKYVLLNTNSDYYDHLPYPTFKDTYIDNGPLGGIHAGLQRSTTSINLFVPCDMPLVDEAILKALIESSKNAMASVPTINNIITYMPFCFNKSGQDILIKQLNQGNLKLGSLLKNVNPKLVPWKMAEKNSSVAMNINHPGEVLQLLDLQHD